MTEEINEISKKTLGSYVKKAADDLAFKAYDAGSASDRDKGKTNYSKAVQRLRGIKKASDKLTKEEVEQIDEISKDTKDLYIKRSSGEHRMANVATRSLTPGTKQHDYWKRKEQNRKKGLERAFKEDLELEEAIKLNSQVKIHAPGKAYHGEVGYVGEIRHGLYKSAPKKYTVDYGDRKSVQLGKENIKLHKEELEFEEDTDREQERARLHANYKKELPHIIKGIKAKTSAANLRREFGMHFKRVERAASDEYGTKYTRQHLLTVANKHLNEMLELDEARRGRPRKDGTKPEGDEDGGREHIIMQLRKVVNLRGQKKVEFNDDSKHDIDVEHAKKALARHDSMHRAADKQDYANKLAKSHASFKQTVTEAADPSTMRSDRGDVKPVTMIGADGRVKVFKHREARKPIKIGSTPKYANEQVEIEEALKGDQHKIDANKNGKVDGHDFKLLRMKKHIKEALKGAQHRLDANKNKRIDAHDFHLLRKKKEMKESSEQETLNKLYESLSEENREKFLRTLETDEGKEALLTFAREQGF
jgi:hypothetical protein